MVPIVHCMTTASIPLASDFGTIVPHLALSGAITHHEVIVRTSITSIVTLWGLSYHLVLLLEYDPVEFNI